ncbi:uncharacterized protein [Medicago truncatula]|uniref:uncharacterized protein n=1 Tax=Medicago truncatula TaxID=3880 RepID=UPI000D2F1D7E|nr:uncharacterized protein LOC112420983 [Medicago truncatula]
MCGVREGLGEGVARWFEDNTRRIMGDGRDILFWHDIWVGEIPLKIKFPRLYELVEDKECSVADARRVIGPDRGWESLWRRRLLAWEEESVRECSVLLHNIVLQENVHDAWRWILDPIQSYTVRGAYRFLTTSGDALDMTLVDDVWQKHIPLKVSLFVWRLLRNRIPTKDNLERRRVILPIDTACISGCGEVETAKHLFLYCVIFGSL